MFRGLGPIRGNTPRYPSLPLAKTIAIVPGTVELVQDVRCPEQSASALFYDDGLVEGVESRLPRGGGPRQHGRI